MRPDPVQCRVTLTLAEYCDGAFRGRARHIDMNLHALAIILGFKVDPARRSRAVTDIGYSAAGPPLVCFRDLDVRVRRGVGQERMSDSKACELVNLELTSMRVPICGTATRRRRSRLSL